MDTSDTAPEADPITDELRARMHAQWGTRRIVDPDRMLRLFGLVHDPLAAVAFGDMTPVERLTIIANHQMEAQDWTRAYRTIVAIARLERRQEREEKAAKPDVVTGQSRSRPAAPEPTARERYLLRKAAKRDLARERAGKPPFPQTSPTPPDAARKLVALVQSGLPFT